MKITTPTATLGIRGTTGLVEVPEGAAANNPNNVAVKLYPDADGRVGRIEVNDRAGARLGFLTQGASGFTIRPGAGGARFAAVPLAIPQAVVLRDQGFVRQLHSTQNLGRQVVFQQREFRRANPNFVNPNRPNRQLQPGQQQARTVRPDKSGPDNCSPVSQIVPDSSSNPVTAPVDSRRRAHRTARDSSSRAPRRDPAHRHAPDSRNAPACQINPALPPRAGQPPRSDLPAQPGLPPRAGQPQQPYLPAQPGAPQGRPGPNRFGVPGLQRAPGVQGAPALQRPGSRCAEAAGDRTATAQAAAERATLVE